MVLDIVHQNTFVFFLLLLMNSRPGYCGKKPLDLVFAFDSSKSITRDGWIKQVDLVQNLLHLIRVSNEGAHVGIIDFSDHVHDRVTLVEGYQDSFIYTKLKDMKLHYEGGTHTYTDKALADAANLFKQSPLSRNALSVLVMLTDGKMTLENHFEGKKHVLERVSELRALGVKIFCITFGDALYIEGLHAIVGTHNNEDIYQSHSFNATLFIQRLNGMFSKEEDGAENSKEQETRPQYERVCNESFFRIGCFYDHQVNPRPMPDLLFTDRNPKHANFSGTNLDLMNWNSYITDIVCRCARTARALRFKLFSTQFYGECYGKNEAHGYAKDGPALSQRACISKDFKACGMREDKSAPCVGKQYHNYVYILKSN